MTISDDRFFIIAGIVGLALVLLAVGLIAAMRGRNKPTLDESPIDSTPAPSWVKNIAGAAGKTLAGAAHTDSPVINASADAIVVLRDAVSNEWLVEVNGMRYQNLKDIHDDKAASKVLAAIGGLQRFAGSIPIVPAAAPEAKKLAASPIPIVPSGESIPFVPPDSLPRLEPVIVSALAQGAATVSQPKHPAPAGSILDQIEKVLQRNLLRDQELTARRIHIGAAADGSLLIEVDWSTYKSAEEVPEVRVRDLIKASIQEWERTA
jgi:hypothetical protein